MAGAGIVCTRSLQLTQKRNKLEQKTLDGVLATRDPDTGETTSADRKCAALDKEMPAMLGVSTAILENVIFCHQEDSNWPLSEPSVLKKKFDDIFSATKYTKALDNIKNIRKEQVVDIKTESKELQHLTEDKDRAVKVCIL